MNVTEFARHVGISPHTIRYYEKIGLLNEVRRLPNGHRFFSDTDARWIRFIQRLKATNMPLDQIREYAELRAQGDATLSARQQLLEAHADTLRDNLARQQHHLDKLNEKIAFYQSVISSKNDA